LCADDENNILDGIVQAIKKYTEPLVVYSKVIGLDMKADKLSKCSCSEFSM